MKKDKAREIVQDFMRCNMRDAKIGRGETDDYYQVFYGIDAYEVVERARYTSCMRPRRRERKTVSVKPKPMYGRWG